MTILLGYICYMQSIVRTVIRISFALQETHAVMDSYNQEQGRILNSTNREFSHTNGSFKVM